MSNDAAPAPSSRGNNTGSTSSDAYSRARTSISLGRGSLTGWAACPLCPAKSSKRFALGRGIAAHLHGVHTPWKPGKAERKRRESERKRRENMRRMRDGDGSRNRPICAGKKRKRDNGATVSSSSTSSCETWTPTQQEIDDWGRRVAELTAQVEADALAAAADADTCSSATIDQLQPSGKRRRFNRSNSGTSSGSGRYVKPGLDRTGAPVARSYRDSLPPLHRAASDGNIDQIRTLLSEAEGDDSSSTKHELLLSLLNERDRNGSTAEHWAAGGGHLDCLKLLHRYRAKVDANDNIEAKYERTSGSDENTAAITASVRRRRDGKTPLHYAARNGRDDVVVYLLEEHQQQQEATTTAATAGTTENSAGSTNTSILRSVDVKSGDGTTPLHLACYSAHLSTVRLLVERYHADPNLKNDWGCGPAHWAAMSINPDADAVVALCQYLRNDLGVRFHERQRQGHSPVHKAAQKKNRPVIQWLAGGDGGSGKDGDKEGASLSIEEKKEAGHPDDGGNRPSDIWESIGGDHEFSSWMRDAVGW